MKLDPRDPTLNSVLLALSEAAHALTLDTIVRRSSGRSPDVRRIFDALYADGLVVSGDSTVAGTERWMLTDHWGLDWARIAVERDARLRAKANRQPYHYGDARGDGRPPEEYWCDWCAGFYGVPHEISDNPHTATHRPGLLCRNAYSGIDRSCACIDCASLRNDCTLLTYAP